MLGISACEKYVFWLDYVAYIGNILEIMVAVVVVLLSNNVACFRNCTRRHIRVG